MVSRKEKRIEKKKAKKMKDFHNEWRDPRASNFECPPGYELVHSYRKADGTEVRKTCRKSHGLIRDKREYRYLEGKR